MHPTQFAYAKAKAAFQAAIECMAEEEAQMTFPEGSDEYYAAGEALGEKYSYAKRYSDLYDAEEALMVWAHGVVMRLPQAQAHKADLETVLQSEGWVRKNKRWVCPKCAESEGT